MSDIKRFMIMNKIEGISYLILLFIAMPLKYIAGFAITTKIAGMIHGILFILFCYQLYKITSKSFISKKESILFFILSLIPFGSFYTERLFKNRFDYEPISVKDF
ncbi:DUF3817 domain-containing protein [Nitratiruptor sp. YY09-18]|uniref:DUF3817 domain-containing protein n=1 Tax=Nitratiruptor sp. YY09-18 TaxID=2724901 RepID=UPI0019150AFE|nr:DUF3817 domain-containing protein [Nitratiruptor sp. YY09-18]BCD68429.1 hypothetical protein NitYY0918_C1344 [Nitratiruptor sp. YY09-18]